MSLSDFGWARSREKVWTVHLEKEGKMTGKTKQMLFVFLTALAVTAVTISGCGRSGKEQQAQKLLEGKYGERFSVSVDKFQELGAGYYTGKAYSAQYPDMPFSVNVDNNGKNFSDNYVERRVC